MSKSSTERAIPEKQFISILKAHDTAAERSASINGEIGERIKHARENANLNLGAYNFVRKLVRMEELKRKDFLASVDIYMDYCRGAGMLGNEHMGDLADMAQQGDAETDRKAAEDEQVKANTEALEKGIKPLDQDRQVRLADVYEQGRIAFLDGAAGMVPESLQDEEPAFKDSWLDGWGDASKASADARVGKSESDAEFDDATSSKPSMPAVQKVGRVRKAAAVGDAAGSYDIRH